MKLPSTLPPLPAAAPEMARRFGVIMAALAVVVAQRFVRAPALVALNVPLWSWLSRTVQRFARLVGQRAVGRPAVVRAARASSARRETAPRARGLRLPSRRGWLLHTLGWEVAVYGSQLETLLAEPDMQALLAARPGMARLMRPLCRMLGVAAPGLALPLVVNVAAVARRAEKRRAARAAVWPRRELPVLAKGAWFAPPVKNWGSGG